jgi:hypothetical protein
MTYIRAKNRQAHKKRMRLELPIATALLQRVRIASMKLVELSSVCNSDRRQRHYVCYLALRYTGDATGRYATTKSAMTTMKVRNHPNTVTQILSSSTTTTDGARYNDTIIHNLRAAM